MEGQFEQLTGFQCEWISKAKKEAAPTVWVPMVQFSELVEKVEKVFRFMVSLQDKDKDGPIAETHYGRQNEIRIPLHLRPEIVSEKRRI